MMMLEFTPRVHAFQWNGDMNTAGLMRFMTDYLGPFNTCVHELKEEGEVIRVTYRYPPGTDKVGSVIKLLKGRWLVIFMGAIIKENVTSEEVRRLQR